MTLDARLADLLLRWDDSRARGQPISPEELCRDCPDMLEDVKRHLRALQTLTSLSGTPQEAGGISVPFAPVGLPVFAGYQVLGELGRGAMGVVYQAYDRKRQQMVALKTLQRMDASSLYRLRQEFHALAEVTHPNLVALYELISTGTQCFLAMELVNGDHFLRYVRSGVDAVDRLTVDYVLPPAPEPESDVANPRVDTRHRLSLTHCERLRAGLIQLAQAISALHAVGKIHRDIKPSNVMVTREGRVVLLDFGLAAELDVSGVHQTTEDHVTGTIAYMAPEQAASQPQSSASDWYNFGVMLYEGLTGRLPFTGTPIQVLMEKQRREPSPPRELSPGVPEDLNDLCVALLRRSPEQRPPAQEVLQRLGGAAPPSRTTPKASFVGRQQHLAELTDAFQVVCKGRTAVVRVSGRSGAGKSMLAQHFLDDLGRHGEVLVLAGKCYERESVPYKTLDSLIDALSRYLRRLPTLEVQALMPRDVQLLTRVFPVLLRVAAVAEAPGRVPEVLDPHDLRRRAFAALRELLARVGDRKRLVPFIDDLQWGDRDGAQLAELFRPPDAPVLLFLACYRSEDADASPCLSVLHRALEEAGVVLDQRHLSVDPLTHQEARDLARILLERHDSANPLIAEAVARESGGNPFFVHVLVQCLTAETSDVDHPLLEGDLTLDQVLWTRIQALPEHARRLLEVIAVSGQPIALADARRAANQSADEQGALAVLRAGRLIRSVGVGDEEEVETYHDRIRETILKHLSANVVKDLHSRIATVLETSVAADVGSLALTKRESKRIFDLAYHFDAAGESARAFPYALAMADVASAQYALEIAEQLYRIAERGAANADAAIRYRVADKLGDVLMLRGNYPQAASCFQEALALTRDTFTQVQTQGKLAELAFKCGDMKTAIEANERALRMLGNRIPRWPGSFLFRLLWETFVQGLHTFFPKWFLARKQLGGSKKQLLTVRLHNRLAYCYWFGKGKIPCLWTHLRGMNLAERYPPTLELAQAYSIQAPVMSLVPYVTRGIAYTQKSFAIYQSLGDLWGQGQSQSFLGMVLYVASRFEESLEKCRAAETLLERTGDLWEVNVARYHRASCLYRLGNLPSALAEAQRIHQSGLGLGDIQATGICLDVWVRASGGQVPPDVLQTELQRSRADIHVSAQVMFAEGVRLFMLDHVEEAAIVFQNAYQLAESGGVKSAWTVPLRPWLASALRRQAEKSVDLSGRKAILKRAWRVAKKAVRIARTFQNDLPHALREAGLIVAMQSNARQARAYLDESLAIAERQGAKFEFAQTLLARGHVGQQQGWLEAPQDLATARQSLHSLGGEFVLDHPAAPQNN